MTPVQPIQTQAAPAQPLQGASDNSNLPDDENAVAGAGINLQRAFSKVNETVMALFDSLGLKRSATIPHIDGQNMSEHIEAVGSVLAQAGGLHNNLLTATHSMHSSTGGETVAHPASKLRETIIPKDSAEAKAAIQSCRSFVSKVKSLVGETPEVKVAKSQTKMIGRNEGRGMTAYDLGCALLSIPSPLIRLIAQRHSEVKHGRIHPVLTGPQA